MPPGAWHVPLLRLGKRCGGGGGGEPLLVEVAVEVIVQGVVKERAVESAMSVCVPDYQNDGQKRHRTTAVYTDLELRRHECLIRRRGGNMMEKICKFKQALKYQPLTSSNIPPH